MILLYILIIKLVEFMIKNMQTKQKDYYSKQHHEPKVNSMLWLVMVIWQTIKTTVIK